MTRPDLFGLPGLGETVTVHRPPDPARDRWGVLLPATTFAVPHCVWAPQASGSARASSEPAGENADTVTTTAAIYGPPGSDFRADDVVERGDGTRWDVDGDPDEWGNPFTGSTPVGCLVRLTRSRG